MKILILATAFVLIQGIAVFPQNRMGIYGNIITAHGPYADGKHILALSEGDKVGMLENNRMHEYCVTKAERITAKEYHRSVHNALSMYPFRTLFMAACDGTGLIYWLTIGDCK